MHITRILLDGFKSYATKTEITGFDSSFNAITGLNGSGKSNILDSICFVLGITNLSHVRANNLQELIYKNGQAGIEKATVSIVFDNSDKLQSPVGYDGCHEITITRQVYKQQGKNRYLINGTVVPANKVKDLFGSVSLNVNNPHFLIMQGRVTKVLNMKPPEILAMLEEATGTRMYEDKKRDTQRTIEKKDSKLAQINQILQEDLEPQMKKLTEERQAFARYKTICRQLEQLQKIHLAWQFICAEKAERQKAAEVELLEKSLEANAARTDEIKELIRRLREEVRELEMKKNAECGDKLQGLEENLKSCELEVAKSESDVNHIKDQIRGEKKSRAEAEENAQEATVQIVQKRADMEKINASSGTLLEDKARADKELELAKKNLEALAMGMTVNENGVAATLTEQLRQVEVDSASCTDLLHQAKNAIAHIEPTLKVKLKQLAETESHFNKDNAEIKSREVAVARLQEQIKALNHDAHRMEKLDCERYELGRELRQLKAEVDNFDACNQNLVFNYSDPYPGFDRAKVVGPVCQLFQLKDPKWAKAIEAAAGGKLFQVIVDTDETAKELLKHGRLQRRVTIIPLNKIRGVDVDKGRLRAAQAICGKDNVFSALHLVTFDQRLEETMKYVFGRTLIASSLDIAEKIAYDRSVNTRTVSVCGSTCDPSGMLSGGSSAPGPSALERLEERRVNSQKLAKLEERYRIVTKELQEGEVQTQRYNALNQELLIGRSEWEQCKARLANSSHAQLREEVEAMRTELEERQKVVAEMGERTAKADAKIKDLKDRMNNAKGEQEKAIKEAKAKIDRCAKAAKAAAQRCGSEDVKLKELQGDIDLLAKEIEEAQQRFGVCDKALGKLADQLKTQEAAKTARLQTKAEAAQRLQEHKEFLKEQSTAIISRYKDIERKQKESDELKLTNQQAEHDAKKKRKEAADAMADVKAMLTEHPWIRRDREHFGTPNGDFDFQRNEPKELSRKVKDLAAQKEKLSKTVNARAHTQASQIETQYKDLMKKRAQVMKDKDSILQTMQELDKRKEETIKAAYKRVNKDFGDIFSNLLSGASAKLQPPEGRSLLDGLEVKVSFGGVWKDSLTELSGGQRSLVALSLILSMLLFKPAPIYILDEVDAALDLAHTQNIGLMIKNHFKGSQFIIVSLKDGLFSNANVLFRTKFVDGKSAVERFTAKQQ
ncbi:structural maintenance of chromosomes protein 2-like [Tropilaelaps mercedesae]|uniref:Structural maintenance of chromosomes protein n=1 Tax=Tropilaelaps mercedesae TaxID=418985 RepID=A0A1V9X2B7_9ACAR|nr:structural maintenance of chromosomes protein 2-like [Tropilaelaps mercedesae]